MDLAKLQADLEKAIILAKSCPSDPNVINQLADLWEVCARYQATFEDMQTEELTELMADYQVAFENYVGL